MGPENTSESSDWRPLAAALVSICLWSSAYVGIRAATRTIAPGALALGRGIRFAIIAGLGAIYGNAIVGFLSRYYRPALWILIGLAVLTSLAGLAEYLRRRKVNG